MGRTLFRAIGALLLAVSATAIDNPHVLLAPGAPWRVATVPVVIAAKDIPAGVIIGRDALAIAQWPGGTQPAGAYRTKDDVDHRVSRFQLYKGEALVPGHLETEGVAAIDLKIAPGKYARSIRVNDVASLAGMIQTNSRVDIMVVVDDGDPAKRVARLFLSNMRVLAIGPASERAPDGRPLRAATAVAIEVTPLEGERLAAAAAQGSFQLVLRGYGDRDSALTKGATGKDIITDLKRRSPDIVRKQVPVSPCGPQNNSIFHDLLRRSCDEGRLKFKRDSVPPGQR